MIDLRERLERLRALKDATPKNIPVEALQRLNRIIETMENLLENPKIAEVKVQVLADEMRELAEEIAPNKPAVHKIPLTTSPFNDKGAAPVGNNPPCHVLFEAVAKGGPNARKQLKGWKENTQDTPVFQDPQRVKGDWTVYFDPQADSPITPWRRVEGLSALHTKLGLFAFAKICDPRNNMRYPNKEPVGVSYEDLRRALGLREKPMTEFRLLANRLVKDWADLKATVRGIMINGKPDGIAECSLFVVSKVWDKQFEMFGERVQIGWLFDPGPWAKYYFNRDAKPWLSTLQQALLNLDHREARQAEVLALHIATLLFVVAGGDQFKEGAITRTVAELLEIAGRLPEPEHRGANWANRMAEALHVALETLLGARLVAAVEFGTTYPDPGDRGKGWVSRWLNATVTLTTPEAAAFLGQDKPEPKAKLPPRLEKKLQRKPDKRPGERLDEVTANRIRAAIAQRFVTQEQAAAFLGCTQSGLSRVLNRNRTPSAELAAKFKALLDSLERE